MKKIKSIIRRWRYRRLYHRLFWFYLAKTTTADEAAYHADEAFTLLTGRIWEDCR